ncbi:MAG: sigma-54 dependent transcriptional regulator [Proteobacteria bacterium]|nr:sigma-54 dependent transcriptional regulator [Pseudomonadota bacterium]
MNASGPRILVVEDNDALRRSILLALRESFATVDEAAAGDEAIQRVADPGVEPYDVVLSDLRLPGADGVAVLRAAHERDARTSVLLMTAYGTVETAVEAMRAGAYDFVEKPLDLEQLELRVARAIEHQKLSYEVSVLRAERDARRVPDEIIGTSDALRSVTDLARRVAPTRSTVLLTGETGTGKELVAGLIHRASPRASGPFVKVNCAALPETLLESELFGHERGAFTGADRRRPGRFEEANGGTLLLDEIGDVSRTIQSKLLRALQDQEFHRLGGTQTLRTDARIVAVTNSDLEAQVAAGSFREDLYFRLNVIRIHVPPLRERPEDLLDLAHHYLREFRRTLDVGLEGFSEGALARLAAHDWPGNVRELRNTIERATLLAAGPRLHSRDIVLSTARAPGRKGEWRAELPPESLALSDVERALVLESLRRTGFVQKDACELLGVSRRKLNYMIQRMGITHPSWRRNRAPVSAGGRGSPDRGHGGIPGPGS